MKQPVIPTVCDAGCGTDTTERGLALPGGRVLCAECGGEAALGILDDPCSSEHDRERAREVLAMIDVWRRLDIRRQREVNP